MERGKKIQVFLFVAFIFIIALFFSQESSALVIDQCQALPSGSHILNTSLTNTSTCFNITNSNTILDCNGFTITHSTAGSGNEIGIYISEVSNATVQNCVIQDGNSAGAATIGILFSNTNNSFFVNNTAYANGTSTTNLIRVNGSSSNHNVVENNSLFFGGSSTGNVGISGASTNNLTITNNTISIISGFSGSGIVFLTVTNASIDSNTIRTNGTAAANIGVTLLGTSGISITNNMITTDGSSFQNDGIRVSNFAFSNLLIENNTIMSFASSGLTSGILLSSSTTNANITTNTISVSGGASLTGISSTSTLTNLRILSNNITTTGTTFSRGIASTAGSLTQSTLQSNYIAATGTNGASAFTMVGVSGNVISQNTVISNGSGTLSHAFSLNSNSHNNTLVGNNITASGASNYAISLSTGAMQNNTFNDTVLYNPGQWIVSGTGSVNNTFSNTTFLTLNGSIRFNRSFQIGASEDIIQNKLTVTLNNSFVNGSNLTYLNMSAIVTLNNITFSNPEPFFNDDATGNYSSCTSPRCTEVSFSNNVYVFEVNGFPNATSYAAGAGTVVSSGSSSVAQSRGGGGSGSPPRYAYQGGLDLGDSRENAFEIDFSSSQISTSSANFTEEIRPAAQEYEKNEEVHKDIPEPALQLNDDIEIPSSKAWLWWLLILLIVVTVLIAIIYKTISSEQKKNKKK